MTTLAKLKLAPQEEEWLVNNTEIQEYDISAELDAADALMVLSLINDQGELIRREGAALVRKLSRFLSTEY